MTNFRATPLSNDITKIVRNHYCPPLETEYREVKVWNRTDIVLLEERPDNLWEKHYVRRQDNLQKGYHSVPWEPYKEIGGNVELDPYRLVMTTMEKGLDPEVWKAPKKQFYDDKSVERKKKPRSMHSLKVSDPSPTTFISEVSTPVNTLPKEDIFTLDGFEKIKEHLRESDTMITNVKAGQPFEEYLRVRQEMLKCDEEVEKPNNGMVLGSLSDLALGITYAVGSDSESEADSTDTDEDIEMDCRYLSPTIPTSSRRKSSVGQTLRHLSKIRKSLAIVEEADFFRNGDSHTTCLPTLEESVPLIKISSGITEKKERLRRDQLQYLEDLYRIIVALHNIKQRDLKSKVPLSHSHVKTLQKEYIPPPNSTLVESRLARLPNKLGRASTCTVDSDTTTAPTRRVNFSEPQGSHHNTGVVSKMNFQRRKSIRVPMEAVMLAIKDKRKLSRPSVTVETWEDLLALEDKPFHSGIQLGTQANIIVKAMQWHRKITGDIGCSEPEPRPVAKEAPVSQYAMEQKPIPPSKRLPIWQLIAQEKYNKVSSVKIKNPSAGFSPNLAQSNRQKLNKMRMSVHQELDASLQKLERERHVSFKMKYDTFDHQCPLFEQHIAIMRKPINNMNRTNMDVLDVPPSKWYDETCEKTYSLTGYNDPEVNSILNKLSKFSTMDGKTVPQSKAKLCLLVMSLPAYDILTIHMQKSIKYVLETILLGEFSMLEDWLQQRKIPVVLEK